MRRKETKALGGMAVEYCGKRNMSKGPKYLLVFVFMAALCGRLQGATYYISADGNNGNSGDSPEGAWRSIKKVNGTVFLPGDSILFKAGETFNGGLVFTSGGTAAEPITVCSYGSGRATISSGDERGFYSQNCGGFEIKDIVFSGSKNPELERNEHQGIYFEHTDGGAFEEHIFVDNVDIRGYMNGIVIGCFEEDNIGYKDIRITKTDIHDNWDKAILIHGYFPRPSHNWANRDVYIADCKVYANSGISASQEISGNGIELSNTQNGLVEFCQAYYNGELCYSKNYGPLGVSVWESDNVIVQYCQSYKNNAVYVNGGGFSIGGGARYCIAQCNYSHDNDGAGFLVWNGSEEYYNNTTNNTYRYNISERDGFKNGYGAITSATDSAIFNTVIHNNTLYMGSWGTGACIVAWSGITYNTSFRNNIFVTAPGKKVIYFLYTTGGWNFQNNCYWSYGSPIHIDWGGNEYTSLDDWRSATGQEILEGSALGFEIDPQLVNPGGGGIIEGSHKLNTLTAYRLQETSPLIDKGLDLQKLFGIDAGRYDFYGGPIPQGGGYDIGAHEYAEIGAEVAACPEAVVGKPVFEPAEQDGYKLISPLPFSVFRADEIIFQVECRPGALPPDEVFFDILFPGEIEAEQKKADESYSYTLDCGSLPDGKLFVKAMVLRKVQAAVISGDWDSKGIPILLDRNTRYKRLTHNSEYIKPGDDPSVFLSKLARQAFQGINDAVSFCSGWNEKFLYLTFWVKDEHLNVCPFIQNGQISDYSDMLSQSDSIKIRLDTAAKRSEWRQLDDFELVSNIAGEYRGNRWDDRKHKFLRWGEKVVVKTECSGTVNDNKDKDGGYYLFVGIPWSELNLSPQGGERFGFDIQCFDKDVEPERFYTAWSGTAPGNNDNSSEWGNLVLKPKSYVLGYVVSVAVPVLAAGYAGFLLMSKKRRRDGFPGAMPADVQTVEKSHEAKLVDAIKSYIAENYSNPELNRNAIAKYLHLSKDHITHVFKRETGVRLIDYLNQVRIENAKELLKDERLSVSEVGFAVGYNTLQHFYKNFKKITGYRPSEYRSLI